MFSIVQKYLIYALVVLLALSGGYAGWTVIKNKSLQIKIVQSEDENKALIDNNKGLEANLQACNKNLENIKVMTKKQSEIKKKQDEINNSINNYKPNSSTGDKENAKEDEAVIIANNIISIFNKSK